MSDKYVVLCTSLDGRWRHGEVFAGSDLPEGAISRLLAVKAVRAVSAAEAGFERLTLGQEPSPAQEILHQQLAASNESLRVRVQQLEAEIGLLRRAQTPVVQPQPVAEENMAKLIKDKDRVIGELRTKVGRQQAKDPESMAT